MSENYNGGGGGMLLGGICLFIVAVIFLSVFAAVTYSPDEYNSGDETSTEDIYYSKKKDVIVVQKENKKLDSYLYGSNKVTLYNKKYSTDMDGINELMDDQRYELKNILGNTFYKKYVDTGSFQLMSVDDDGKTLRVLVSDGTGMEYEFIDEDGDEYDQSYLVEDREMKNLIRGLTYAFKNTRNVNVVYGYMGRDKYNENVFYNYGSEHTQLTSKYLFKRSELAKVVNWEDYPFKLLLELNEYSESK